MACTASGALGVVYGGEVIYHLDRAFGTGFLTLAAAYASVGAYLAYLSTLVMAAALNYNLAGIVDEADYAVGTFLNTQTAAYALGRIYIRYASLGIDGDSISRTYTHTVAVAEAGEGAVAVTRVIDICRRAALRSIVDILTLRGLTRAVAGNVGNALYDVTCGESHDLCNLLCNSVATGDTERWVVGHALTECLRVSVTSGESARTAVGAGEAVTHCRYPLILLHTEEDRGDRKNKSTYYSNSNED